MHLIVMSVDAMVYEDLACLRQLPNFRLLLEQGSRVERVRSIYPTLTHPIHVSIMTGCYPDKTGVCNNEKLSPGNPAPEWYNDLADVKVKTLFHAAKEAGLTTCACRWPVTAGEHGVIDYLVPEVISEQPGADPEEPYRRGGSAPVLDTVRPYLKGNTAGVHPIYDEQEILIAADLLRKYKPGLLFTHPGYVDNARHQNGLFNGRVNEALALTDQWLGLLFQAAKDAGIYEDTNFVVLSDHGHLEIKRTVNLNAVLADEGLLQLDAAGNLLHWDAWVQSAGLSAQVFLSRSEDASLREQVYTLLCRLRDEGIYGVESVLTAAEAEADYRLAGDFSFVLESDGYSSFQEDVCHPVGRPIAETSDYRYGRTTHGHLPEKGPQPPFLCMGPGFRKGVVLEEGRIVDEAPTLAKLMGLSLPDADGVPMDALLAEGIL